MDKPSEAALKAADRILGDIPIDEDNFSFFYSETMASVARHLDDYAAARTAEAVAAERARIVEALKESAAYYWRQAENDVRDEASYNKACALDEAIEIAVCEEEGGDA